MEVITKNARETQRLGEKIGRSLKKGAIVALYGELGGGKTTFAQGLARGLGVKKRIISPTFVFMRQYPLVGRTFYHVDLYRIEGVEEARGLGVEEVLADPEAVVAIEWAEKIDKILPRERTDIFFEYSGEKERKIKIGKE